MLGKHAIGVEIFMQFSSWKLKVDTLLHDQSALFRVLPNDVRTEQYVGKLWLKLLEW